MTLTDETPEAGEAKPEPLARPIAQCCVPVFAVPLVVHRWPESEALNDELAGLVRSLAGGAASAGRSTVGGWSSDARFLARKEPVVRRLFQRVQTLVGALAEAHLAPASYRMLTEGWASVLPAGGYDRVHAHPRATFSGVYHVTDGGAGPEPAGRLEFVDPRPAAATAFAPSSPFRAMATVAPRPGTMTVFPGWLAHYVHPAPGSEERIAIAFNVTFETTRQVAGMRRVPRASVRTTPLRNGADGGPAED